MKKQRKKNVREVAMDLLDAIEKNQSYSNLLLNHAINQNHLEQKDIGLLTELVYGTLQRKMTLDYYLQPYIKKPNKVESWVKQLLRITVYQMVHLNKIPDHAALNEAVEIAKNKGHKGIASFVNGILRNVQRTGIRQVEEIKDPIQRISIATSHPEWLVARWVDQFGLEATEEMCKLNLQAPTQTARVNRTKATTEEVITLLEEEGYAVKRSEWVSEAIHALRGNLAKSTAFKNGLITIQDESSMLACLALNPQKNERILDACAAPGGKTSHIAEAMSGSGEVIAIDLHEHKVKLIAQTADRLGLENIATLALDSRQVQDHFPQESFDRILLDAPCSGLGVMRRKPDMKYTKKEDDLSRLQSIQLDLLNAITPLLKKGGMLVYSTCTVDESENHQVISRFLSDHKEFVGDSTLKARLPQALQTFVDDFEIQVLPQYIGSDGFYIACLRKKV